LADPYEQEDSSDEDSDDSDDDLDTEDATDEDSDIEDTDDDDDNEITTDGAYSITTMTAAVIAAIALAIWVLMLYKSKYAGNLKSWAFWWP